MRLLYIRVPHHHFQAHEDKLVFRHNWLGNEVFWIVPMIYVVKYELKDWVWQIRLSEAYFNQSTNELAA